MCGEGLLWMGQLSDRLLYVCAPRQLYVWSLNHVVDFWAAARNDVVSARLVTARGKSSRVVAVGEDNRSALSIKRESNRSVLSIKCESDRSALSIERESDRSALSIKRESDRLELSIKRESNRSALSIKHELEVRPVNQKIIRIK